MARTKARERQQKLGEALAEVKRAADAHDDEAAHSNEDRLREVVLKWIVSGEIRGVEAREYAAQALSTSEIDFARWCG